MDYQESKDPSDNGYNDPISYQSPRLTPLIAPPENPLVTSFLLDCRCRNLRPRSISDYDDCLGILLKYGRSINVGIGEFKREHIEKWIIDRLSVNSPATINHRLRCWKVFFAYCVKDKLLTELQNPMVSIRYLKYEKPLHSILEIEQVEAMLNYCDTTTFHGTRDRAMILLMFDTGLRPGEVANLTVGDLDVRQLSLRVRGKSRRERLVPIGPRTTKYIHNYIQRYRCALHGYHLFCCANGDGIDQERVLKRVKVAGKRAGLPINVTPYMLRRTCATLLDQNGMSIELLRRHFGHVDIRTTIGYIQHGFDALQKEHAKRSPANMLNTG